MGQRPKLLAFLDASERETASFIPAYASPLKRMANFRLAGASGEDDEDDDDDTSGADDGAKVSLDRFLKVQKRMRAADRRASTAEGRVTELDKLVEGLPALQKKLEDSESTIKKLRMDNAFLSANDVSWHDAEAALRLADLSDVKINDDGTVTGLKEALTKLAAAKPYLVKKDEAQGKGKGKGDDDGDDDDLDEDEDDTDDENDDTDDQDDTSGGGQGGNSGRQGGGASGTSTGSGKRKRKTKGPTDEELLARYRI